MTERELTRVIELRRRFADGRARQTRVDRGLSLGEAGRAAGGIPASTIFRWENSDRVPRAGRAALAYARLLERLEG